jgi:hypothetical protein
LEANEIAETLADKYVSEEIIPQRYRTDGIHIAMATINDLDIGLVQQPVLMNPIGFGLLNKSRKRLRLLQIS